MLTISPATLSLFNQTFVKFILSFYYGHASFNKVGVQSKTFRLKCQQLLDKIINCCWVSWELRDNSLCFWEVVLIPSSYSPKIQAAARACSSHVVISLSCVKPVKCQAWLYLRQYLPNAISNKSVCGIIHNTLVLCMFGLVRLSNWAAEVVNAWVAAECQLLSMW